MDPRAREALDRMVDRLVAERSIRSSGIEQAFRKVPRHLFLPAVGISTAYTDDAIPTKCDGRRYLSSSSQPTIMAIMLEQLELEPGQRVLEIGAGTGYNAALLAEIVGPRGHVTTIDIDLDTSVAAREHLRAAGFERVTVFCADGREGWSPGAPYDRIVATAAIEKVPDTWTNQLALGGILVAPLGGVFGQHCTAFKLVEGRLVQRSAVGCGFMLMRDAAESSAGDRAVFSK